MADRPYCQRPAACHGRTEGKHCPACAARTPECTARRRAAQLKALADPEALARRQAGQRKTAADPVATERRRAALKVALAHPDVKARHKAGARAAALRRAADPVARQTLVENGRKFGKANFHHANTDEAKAKRGATIRAIHLAWCPPEYWDLNEQLKRKGHRLPVRKQMIARKIAEATIALGDHFLAADFLRRYAAVYRCSALGALDPIGTHWRYGSRVLDRHEAVQLAMAKGWKPERLAA